MDEPARSAIPPPSRIGSFLRSLLPPFLYAIVIQSVAVYIFVMPDFYALYQETGEIPVFDAEWIGSAPHFPHALLFGAMASIILFQFTYHRNVRHFTLKADGPLGVAPLILLVSVAGNYTFTSGITVMQRLLDTKLPTSSLDGIGEDTDIFLLLLATCIVVPIAEELCFRALSLNFLRRSFPFVQANLIQAAVFGIVHGTPIQIGYAFLFGLFLGWVYHRTGRIGVILLSHIAFNSANILLAFIPGIENVMGDTGQLALFILAPSLLATLAGLHFLGKKLRGAAEA